VATSRSIRTTNEAVTQATKAERDARVRLGTSNSLLQSAGPRFEFLYVHQSNQLLSGSRNRTRVDQPGGQSGKFVPTAFFRSESLRLPARASCRSAAEPLFACEPRTATAWLVRVAEAVAKALPTRPEPMIASFMFFSPAHERSSSENSPSRDRRPGRPPASRPRRRRGPQT
jgi:hypothetical protein